MQIKSLFINVDIFTRYGNFDVILVIHSQGILGIMVANTISIKDLLQYPTNVPMATY